MARENTVYSTDQGRHCPSCGNPVTRCTCRTQVIASRNDVVTLQRQVKGRNGKPITIVSGLALAGAELKNLAKELKKECSVGGSIDGQDILIQGDKRDRLTRLLESKGYKVKLTGG